MKFKVIMDSGKEYVVSGFESREDLISNFVIVNKLPMGNGSVTKTKDEFVFLYNDETVLINPSHVSSVEVVGE
ncbi:hypothetical protein [Bacillus solitudinis]|uniref:hypothetical protein n=1 Tax=Bacillus solitudinis TaxID=2014074 RepID=UPI000C231754|nr:hypothetical protein [Bacillus solitudinis]